MKFCFGTDINISASTVVTIGKFDGLHIGHISLLKHVINTARKNNLDSVVFSFSPHPAEFFTGIKVEPIITLKQKIQILSRLGIDNYIEYPFTSEFANTPPEVFLEEIIHKLLKCRILTIGQDYRFGKSGKGDIALARQAGVNLGFEVDILPLIKLGDNKVSSEEIRRLIANNEKDKIQEMLGHYKI